MDSGPVGMTRQPRENDSDAALPWVKSPLEWMALIRRSWFWHSFIFRQRVMKLKRNSRPPVLAKGQIWKIDGAHLEITHLGKRLTEYKRYRDLAKRRAMPEMAHIEEVQSILLSQQAALIQQPRA